MPTLNWIGKEAVIRHHKNVPLRLLEPVTELSHGEDSGSLLVQGDNLDALKALLPRYAGKVKCIYIDPPYNTGNEGWSYNDNVNSPEIRRWLGQVVGKEGETLDRHDRWLCMMCPRLVLLRQFLREDGAIFISIDDNEQANLKLLCDEIFGKNNFIANVIWQKRTSPDARLNLGPAHDFILVYSKKIDNFKSSLHKVPPSTERLGSFKNLDNDTRGVWTSVDITGQTGHATPNQFYTIISPSGEKFDPPPGRCWAYSEETIRNLIADNRIWFGKNGKNRPRLKQFLSEKDGVTVWTWWTNEEVGHNQEATKELNETLQMVDAFPTPKPTRLIQRILQITSDKDSIILDSFAGSGTTGHAVLRQNAEDGGNRKFILVEMDKKIAENVTAERLKRACSGYENAKGQEVEGLGSGFQFCRLSEEPLFTPDGRIRKDVTFEQLAAFVWFLETKTGYAGKADSPLLGVHEGRAIYLLYNGILGDKSEAGGNVLTREIYERLPAHAGPKTIYAGAAMGCEWLAQEDITFRQTPYELGR